MHVHTRAKILGHAGASALVRCGACRFKVFVGRADWERLGAAICPNCRASICYADLSVHAPHTPGGCDVESLTRKELEELRALEGLLRAFVEFYDRREREFVERGGRDDRFHPFVKETRELVRDAREIVGRIDGLRAR